MKLSKYWKYYVEKIRQYACRSKDEWPKTFVIFFAMFTNLHFRLTGVTLMISCVI